mmetsp:Transcript_92729/g.300006  ORF Transcript_92729/g.300006 Transcript_92729/m.300006 type:complete len:262 (-) Transcript_92729:3617-4402(-)
MPQFSLGGSATLSSNHSKLAGQTPNWSRASKVDISSTTFSPSLIGMASSSTSRGLSLSFSRVWARALALAAPAPSREETPASPEGMSSSPSGSSSSSSMASSIPRSNSEAIPLAKLPTAFLQLPAPAPRPRFGGRGPPRGSKGAPSSLLCGTAGAAEDEDGAAEGADAPAGTISKSSGSNSRAAAPQIAASLAAGSPNRVASFRKARSARVTAKPPLCWRISWPCFSRMCLASCTRRPGAKVSRNLSAAANSQISANSSGE